MGTSGMTSQAYGQHDLNEITRLLLRSVGVGLFIALCLLILQYPILKLAFTLIQTTPEVEQLATTYFYISYLGSSRHIRTFMDSPVGLSECRIHAFPCISLLLKILSIL